MPCRAFDQRSAPYLIRMRGRAKCGHITINAARLKTPVWTDVYGSVTYMAPIEIAGGV